jgi:uncharacterized repeat protein (TIGR04076 family)
MDDEAMIGYPIIGTIKSVKGTCSAGHQVGDQIELSAYHAGGMCGFFYHDVFPYVVMLQFGGGFPSEYGDPNVVELECVDKVNAVKIELKRLQE